MSINPVGEPTREQLRANHVRTRGRLEDRDLSGDLLLVGLAFAHVVDFHPTHEWKVAKLAEWLFPCPPHAHGPAYSLGASSRIARVLKNDIRRYVPPRADTRCAAPVRGRDTSCGRAGSAYSASLTDLTTGETSFLRACTRHVTWLRVVFAENREACALAQVPVPCANTGGVLRRHLPELDWQAFWPKLDPTWTEAPEVGDMQPPRALLPVPLKVIRGDGDSGLSVAPALTLLEGGRDA